MLKRIEGEWTALVREFGDAGWQCVLARYEAEKFPATQTTADAYLKASERWVELVLKTSDFVRDCRNVAAR